MIIDGLLSLLMLLLLGLTFLLPTYTPPQGADLSAFQVIAWLIPIGEIITLTSVIVSIVVVSLTYAFINWAINKIRGAG